MMVLHLCRSIQSLPKKYLILGLNDPNKTKNSNNRYHIMAEVTYKFNLELQDDPQQAKQVLNELKAQYGKSSSRAGSLTQQARQAIAQLRAREQRPALARVPLQQAERFEPISKHPHVVRFKHLAKELNHEPAQPDLLLVGALKGMDSMLLAVVDRAQALASGLVRFNQTKTGRSSMLIDWDKLQG